MKPHLLPFELALIRWSVVHLQWHETANDMPNLTAFLTGWGARCLGMENTAPPDFQNSFRRGWREADDQIAIALQRSSFSKHE